MNHSATWKQGSDAITMFGGVVVFAVVGCIFLGVASLAIGAVVGAIALAYGIAKHGAARAMRLPGCVTPGTAISYSGWYGSTHAFEIQSDQFAATFLAANQRKLINVSGEAAGALHALRAHEKEPPPRLLAPPPAVEEQLLKWISKLESLKGPSARSAALAAGLAEIHEPAARQKLMVEASGIEARAALDKADGLKTISAKRRTLEAAIQGIRASGIPGELSAESISSLERALADLGASGEQK